MRENVIIEDIKKLGLVVSSLTYSTEEDENIGNFNYRTWWFPQENYKLKGSPFYQDKTNDFIHFTSIENLYSIINTGNIRLYNLVNMDDKFELEYGLKKLNFRRKISSVKEELFCLSLCKANKILTNITNEHLLWKLHGRNGHGAIIRLSFKNDLNTWLNYHLSDVFYNTKIANSIKKLNRTLKNEGIESKICSFFKLPIYKFENETRLVFDGRISFIAIQKNPEGQMIYPKYYFDKFHKKDNILYVELPIFNFNKSNLENYKVPNLVGVDFEMPKIEISEIILGYRFSEDDKNNIEEIIKQKDEFIKVKITDLRKYYKE